MYMLVTGCMPSGGVDWLALLRVVWVAAPCWALPRSASSPLPYAPVLTFCRFHVASVKPRWYGQSCIRLCIADMLAVAVATAACSGEASVAGSHRRSFHWLVNGYR